MTTKTQARAQARALVGAAAFGSLVGLAIGCAYLGGEAAHASMIRAQAERFAGAAKSGYSERSLIQAAGGSDRNALAIAHRHDPYLVAGGAQRDLQAAAFAANYVPGEPDSQSAGLRRITFHPTAAASPFRMEGALDASRDLQCLTEAVYFEARGEGATGMAAVAQVVLNRVRHPAFPKTVCGVVYQGAGDGDCQFSFACQSHAGPQEDLAWSRARNVASRALSGHVMTEVGQSTNFHAVSVSPDWMNTLQRVAQVGGHVFYRFGHAGPPKDFRYTGEPIQKPPQPILASLMPSFGSNSDQPTPTPVQPVTYPAMQKALTSQAASVEAGAATDGKPVGSSEQTPKV